MATTDNADEFLASLGRHARKVPFATVVALTRTAKETRDRLTGRIRVVFDRPRSMTVRGLYMKSATKAVPRAEVGVKSRVGRGNAPAQWLAAEILGGPRRPKRSARAIESRASARFAGQWVPASGMKLDRYGNVSQATIKRILADIGAISRAPANDASAISSRPRARRSLTPRRGYGFARGAR